MEEEEEGKKKSYLLGICQCAGDVRLSYILYIFILGWHVSNDVNANGKGSHLFKNLISVWTELEETMFDAHK